MTNHDKWVYGFSIIVDAKEYERLKLDNKGLEAQVATLKKELALTRESAKAALKDAVNLAIRAEDWHAAHELTELLIKEY